MRKLSVIFFAALSIFAAEHIVKVEPFEIYTIKSAVSAKVLKSRIDKEAKVVENEEIIRLDDIIDKKSLSVLKKKLINLENILKIDIATLKNLDELIKIKRENYNRIKDLKTKSKFEKDVKYSDYLITYNQFLAQKSKIENLKNQIADIKLNIDKLKDSIEKKSIKVSGYIYKIYAKDGDFVNFGSPLVDVADISKGKIVLYLDKDEIKDLDKKSLYINGEKKELKFYKLQKIADSVHISAYRAEILVDSPKIFSKLVKVEIK